MKSHLDIEQNRSNKNYSRSEILLRITWHLLRPFFKYSPRICFRWRALLLKLLGAKIGQKVHIYNSATIYFPWNLEIGDWSAIGEDALIYNLGQVKIGTYTTISQRSHLCAGTHDYSRPDLPLIKTPIMVGDNVWVCADAFIGPGVTVGDNSIVGARAVVTKDVDHSTIVAGNPARFVKHREMTDK